MPHSFVDKLAAVWPPEQWRDVTIILAVSGGSDSVSLLRGVSELAGGASGRVVVAHFNHRLRDREADLDEEFVAALSQDLKLPFVVERAVADQLETASQGLESAARQERYRFLTSTAEQWGARFVVTAHTADDNAETILHRILRGTGLKGLGGIPRARPLSPDLTLIRPLLSFRRAEITDYLTSQGQPFRLDSSNRDNRFTRNRIRLELMPRLAEDYNQEVAQALVRLASVATQVQTVLDDMTARLQEECLVVDDGQLVEVSCQALAKVDAILVCELFIAIWKSRSWPLLDMGLEKWNELASMAQADSSERIIRTFPGGIQARRAGDRLRLEARAPDY